MLVRWVKGEVQEKRRRVKWEILRAVSIDVLLQDWGASVSDLDQITETYLQPSSERSGNRQHNKGGGKRDNDSLTHQFKMLRTHRLNLYNKSS